VCSAAASRSGIHRLVGDGIWHAASIASTTCGRGHVGGVEPADGIQQHGRTMGGRFVIAGMAQSSMLPTLGGVGEWPSCCGPLLVALPCHKQHHGGHAE